MFFVFKFLSRILTLMWNTTCSNLYFNKTEMKKELYIKLKFVNFNSTTTFKKYSN